MGQTTKTTPVLFAVVALGALLAYLYWPNAVEEQRKKRPDTPVVVEEVNLQSFPILLEALGTARANEALTITAQETDIVAEILFDDGALVKKDQVLVRLNAKEEQARFNELKINLKEAKRQLLRIKDLAKENAASAQLLDEQQAEVDAFRAQLQVAQSQLTDRVIVAPFDGVLGLREVSIGALVRPGDTITTLDDLHLIKVDFSVAEEHLASVALNQLVTAKTVAYPGQEFTGEITHIAARIDPATRSLQARAVINNQDLKLRPGMLLQIVVQKQNLSTLVVPETALVPVGDKQFVYVVGAENKVKQTEVLLGERKPGFAQVLEGIKEGDNIVTQGTLRLRDGATVKVVEQQ